MTHIPSSGESWAPVSRVIVSRSRVGICVFLSLEGDSPVGVEVVVELELLFAVRTARRLFGAEGILGSDGLLGAIVDVRVGAAGHAGTACGNSHHSRPSSSLPPLFGVL